MKKQEKQCEHKWGPLQKEMETSWAYNDETVKFYYQQCEKCGIIRVIAK